MVLDRKRVAWSVRLTGGLVQRLQLCAVGVPDRRGEEGAESKGEALDLPVNLRHAPTLTYGHELWVMTERTRSPRIQAAEMSFLHAGWLGDPLEIGHLGRLPREVFQACPTGRRPRGRPRTRWRDYVSRLAWERLGVPPEELEEVSGVREVWASLLRLLPPRTRSRIKWLKMDGWMHHPLVNLRGSDCWGR
ncbi:hypothetical protein L3Q82_012215 [Scortum barcoo]|uniref:Uncharacterized protein n=1 Tax=Scortum barcoo TaxID=214431 RepID=A0ACB8W245_9TELE|nr:hypothetical protein L3Q82_012215 [Scortum barcoo]